MTDRLCAALCMSSHWQPEGCSLLEIFRRFEEPPGPSGRALSDGPSEPAPSVEVRVPTRGGWPVSLSGFRCACRRERRCQRLRRCHSGPWKPAPLRAGGQARPGGRRAGWTSPASARPEQARTSKAPGTEAQWGICRLRVGSRLQGTQWHCPPGPGPASPRPSQCPPGGLGHAGAHSSY